mmetsp:Transcript_20835/g.14945  ORF Transcript_20835/g.14945 Transcript_20835/m.14945 type:complete len:94 (+) Transcript_20835:313-594(+)
MPVHAIRGNHDCYFNDNLELDLDDQYEQWNMPNFYYKEEFPIGDGKKLGVLMVDSCLMLCANWTYADDSDYTAMLSEEHKMLRDVVCNNDTTA